MEGRIIQNSSHSKKENSDFENTPFGRRTLNYKPTTPKEGKESEFNIHTPIKETSKIKPNSNSASNFQTDFSSSENNIQSGINSKRNDVKSSKFSEEEFIISEYVIKEEDSSEIVGHKVFYDDLTNQNVDFEVYKDNIFEFPDECTQFASGDLEKEEDENSDEEDINKGYLKCMEELGKGIEAYKRKQKESKKDA